MHATAVKSRAHLAMYALSALFLIAPGASYAAVSVSANQILPPGQQSCPVVGATDITPYIYDGALHSFDISISDSSYVAVSGQAGEASIGFNYVTRLYDANGGVKLHVDLPSLPLTSDTPVSVTLISGHPENTPVTCVITVSTVVPAVTTNGHVGGSGQGTSGTGSGSTGSTSGSGGQTGSNSGINPPRPAYPWNHISYSKPKPTPVVHTVKTPTTTVHIPPLVTATHSLGNVCSTTGGPAKLWGILLVLYAIFVWLIATMRGKDLESSDWNVGLVVAGFLGLLFFWYVSALCRTGSWAPILATIIACAGLIALTQSGTKGGKLLLLNDPQKV